MSSVAALARQLAELLVEQGTLPEPVSVSIVSAATGMYYHGKPDPTGETITVAPHGGGHAIAAYPQIKPSKVEETGADPAVAGEPGDIESFDVF